MADVGAFLAVPAGDMNRWDVPLKAAIVAVNAESAAVFESALYLEGTGIGNEATAIQGALDAAGADQVVRLYGTFATSSTITVKGNLDASGAVINYTGTGVAVQVGLTASATHRKTVLLPRVVNGNKSGLGWAEVVGSTGVRVVNLNSSAMLVVPHVQSFAVGVEFLGQAAGVAYDSVLLGHLDNNKVNQKLTAASSGWANQMVFTGGRFSHNSGEGTNVSGVRQIQLDTGLTNVPNNNLWLNPSIEGDTAEYHLDMAGVANMIINGRYEVTGGARVRWQADAITNTILYGYKADQIVETRVAGSSRNHVISSARWQAAFNGAGVVLENTGSSDNPSLRVMAAGANSAESDPDTAYAVKLAANFAAFKRSTDTVDRVQVDIMNGRLYFGNGSTALARYLANLGTTAIGVNGGNLSPGADNTLDLGQASFRWRYVRAGTGLQPGVFTTATRPAPATAGAGTMIMDSTLSKPVWVNPAATGYIDATGAAV